MICSADSESNIDKNYHSNVDVFFLFREKVIEMISEENWEMLKADAGVKKVFLIKESDNMFILKI